MKILIGLGIVIGCVLLVFILDRAGHPSNNKDLH